MAEPVLHDNGFQIEMFRPEHQPWFEQLNRAWIEKYFWLEPVDQEVLSDPEKHILAKGGFILMASQSREIIGTVAMKSVEPRVFEFSKMAVAPSHQGRGVGKALSLAALEKARDAGARQVILYSSTRLQPALALYRKLGFTEVPVDGPYQRSDIKMQLSLENDENRI